MDSLFLILGLAVLFYLLIPGAGAFYVRSQWRDFRRRLNAASTYTIVEYAHLRAQEEGYLGSFRAFGTLEAIQGDDIIWVRSGSLSLSVDMRRVSVFQLPTLSDQAREALIERNESTLPDEAPQKIPWDKIFSLPEGTKVYVSGSLYGHQGQAVFRSDTNDPLTVVLYDGVEETILRRAIWGGRQRNEYWNQFTPASLAAGFLSLLILAYVLLRSPMMRLPALVSLSFSLIPVIPLLPPGVVLHFLYRRLWRRGRFLRAERDLVRLPLRYFDGQAVGEDGDTQAILPNGRPYACRVYRDYTEFPPVKTGAKIRTTSLIPLSSLSQREYFAFGTPVSIDGEAQVAKPDDPMAELVLIPGNPERLAASCDNRARLYEILAAGAFFTGILMNLYLVFAVLARLIR